MYSNEILSFNGSMNQLQNWKCILPSVTSQNDLGVIITNNLSWTPHIDKCCKSAYLYMNLIKRTFIVSSTPTEPEKALYLSLVRSD